MHRIPAVLIVLGCLLFGAGTSSNFERGSTMDSSNGHRPRFVEAGGEHPHTNRLIDETSPYLLQHAHNPVDWYPWGPGAFGAAREQDKPIFLSVGYSTCYWCHVMERESFESEATAAVMNEHFICIKVDREERPDVDDLYMTAVQMFSNGHGGWPMSVFLEPTSLKPFFAGTYFPPTDLHARPGFATLLERIATMWDEQRDGLLQQADRAADAITAELQATAAPVALDERIVEAARVRLLSSYDPRRGGFDSAPKFPQPGRLDFLLQTAGDDEDARTATLHTLDAMSMGGMYDQIGGGFHRYSTDAEWLVPHFEKMLYDNGQLAETYARAFELTADPWYGRILRQTLDYVLREMTESTGRFFSAQDAEVDASEGASYVWTREGFAAALRAAGLQDEIEYAEALYGVDRGTNFRDPHDESAPPVNVLFLASRPGPDAFERIDHINAALLQARNQRKQPITDDKTLTGWNGLMIAGFAEAGRVLEDDRYLDAAIRASEFLLTEMHDARGGLLRTWRGGRAAIPAFLEDYAYFAHGLLRLHAATRDARWLDAALALLDEARQHFGDPTGGGYFDSRPGQTDLFVRIRSRYDGATPSANSLMLLNLLAAEKRTGQDRYRREAASTLASMSRRMSDYPTAALVAMRGLELIAREHPDALPQGETGSTSPVRISVNPAVLDLTEGPADLAVTIDVEDGFHVNAHAPGEPGLTGIELVVVGDGATIEVDYPAGAPLVAPFATEPVLVHDGSTTLNVRVRRTGGGNARLVLKWQACDDRACLAPSEDVLPVVLETR